MHDTSCCILFGVEKQPKVDTLNTLTSLSLAGKRESKALKKLLIIEQFADVMVIISLRNQYIHYR